MNIQLSSQSVRRLLLICWAILVVAGLGAEFAHHVLGVSSRSFLVYFLSLEYEMNLPTWFISAMQLMCAILLTFIAIAKRRIRAPFFRHWAFLALVFYYISIDEFTEIHEYGSHFVSLRGIFYYSWVIPATFVVFAFFISYLGFLWRLPRRACWQFVLAGATFVGGAVGVEMILGYWADIAGDENIMWSMINLCEEGLELLGIALFLSALVEYTAREYASISIDLRVKAGNTATNAFALPKAGTSVVGVRS